MSVRWALVLLLLCASNASADMPLYLSADGTSLPPPTIRGAWTDTDHYVTRRLVSVPDGRASRNTFPVTVANQRTLAYVGNSLPLTADTTIDGSVSWFWNVAQHDAALWSALHLWVMAPDGSLRCTLVSNYVEDSDTMAPWPEEVPTNTTGLSEHASALSVTMSSCAALAGDRLVAEMGTNGTATQIGGYGRMGYGRQVPSELLMPPSLSLSHTVELTPESCAVPAIQQLTTDTIRFRLDEPERCGNLFVFRNAFDLPVATYLRGELPPVGDEFVVSLLSDVGDQIGLRCCCGACQPKESHMVWSHAGVDELDTLASVRLYRNGIYHSDLLPEDVLTLGNGEYAHPAQWLHPELCEGDTLGLRVCITAHGACIPDEGGPCVVPEIPEQAGCPDGYTYDGSVSRGPCGE